MADDPRTYFRRDRLKNWANDQNLEVQGLKSTGQAPDQSPWDHVVNAWDEATLRAGEFADPLVQDNSNEDAARKLRIDALNQAKQDAAMRFQASKQGNPLPQDNGGPWGSIMNGNYPAKWEK